LCHLIISYNLYMYRPFLLLSIAFVSVITSYGQNKTIEKKLDELLAKQFRPTEPGCAILVAKQGNIIYNKAFGSANLELGVPMRPHMVFKIASITKQFTAVAILQLVEKGLLNLKDSLQKYIPDYPSKGYTITIENLLTHTSGIRDYMQIDYGVQNMERWDFSPAQLIDSFKNYPLQFEPGTKFSYSNSGYYLLGYIIAKVSGKSYQQYIRENILTPLALSHSYFDEDNIVIPNRVNGYRKEGATFKNSDFWSPSIAYAAGGLLSSTADLYTWFKGLLSYKILKKETLDQAFTPFKLKDGSVLTYGYGWYILKQGNIQSIEHGGRMNGFLSNEVWYPQEDVFIAGIYNSEQAPKNELSLSIAGIVLGRSLQTGITVSDSILDSYVGTYSLTIDPGRTIVVSKVKDHLVASVSGQQTFEILFQTTSTFQLKSIPDLTGEFIKENGNVVKFIVYQNGRFEWKKIK
jgi:CubicO group peptidase (beta-lactamase class C family)